MLKKFGDCSAGMPSRRVGISHLLADQSIFSIPCFCEDAEVCRLATAAGLVAASIRGLEAARAPTAKMVDMMAAISARE